MRWIVGLLLCASLQANDSFCPEVLIGSTAPAPGMWSQWEQQLREGTEVAPDPFLQAGFDLDAIGSVLNMHRNRFPVLKELESALQSKLEAATFIELRDRAVTAVMDATDKDSDPQTLFAAIEVVRLLSLLESKVEFPFPRPKRKKKKHRRKSRTNKSKSRRKLPTPNRVPRVSQKKRSLPSRESPQRPAKAEKRVKDKQIPRSPKLEKKLRAMKIPGHPLPIAMFPTIKRSRRRPADRDDCG